MRQPAGIVWTELQHRRYALRNKPEEAEALARINALLSGIEKEFEEDVAFERELWGGTLEHLIVFGPTDEDGEDGTAVADQVADTGPAKPS